MTEQESKISELEGAAAQPELAFQSFKNWLTFLALLRTDSERLGASIECMIHPLQRTAIVQKKAKELLDLLDTELPQYRAAVRQADIVQALTKQSFLHAAPKR